MVSTAQAVLIYSLKIISIVDNGDDGIELGNQCSRVLIKSNDIKENSDRGIFVSGSTANDGIIEDNM